MTNDYPELTGKTILRVEERTGGNGSHDDESIIYFTDGSRFVVQSNGAAYCSSYLSHEFFGAGK